MNITEANDLNYVLSYVLNVGQVPSSDKAMEAAARLADKANKALGAGLTGERVRAAWPDDEDEPLALRDARDAERESAEADVAGCSCGMADYGAPGHDGSLLPETGLNDVVWVHTTDHTACEHPVAVVTTDHQSGRCVMGRRIVRGESS